jgi:hypothetical protein
MRKFEVYVVEELLAKYTVQATTEQEAKKKMLTGNYDPDTYHLVDELEFKVKDIREVKTMSKEQQNRDRLIDYALGEHDFCLGYKALNNQSEHYYDGYIDAKKREKELADE